MVKKIAKNEDWFEDIDENLDDDISLKNYDVSAQPNDFNISTLYDFIESGVLEIPLFQRNYVWDIKRASRLIESILIGLPIPQIFLYELERNKFAVIDGQQRLMTIYYFKKGKFPKDDKRIELRSIFANYGNIPKNILEDPNYFDSFELNLKSSTTSAPNDLHGLSYETLSGKRNFDLRTIRVVIIKQVKPADDDHSSMYEIFYRLNTGGINLKPQEIRACLYHSNFYNMLNRINLQKDWRRLLGVSDPDLHMKDIEILLRGFAMLEEGDNYYPSMTKFLNDYSRYCKKLSDKKISFRENLFNSFLKKCSDFDQNIFFSRQNKFSISTYESIFTAVCRKPFLNNSLVKSEININKINKLKSNEDFLKAAQSSVASKQSVRTRLDKASEILT